MSTKKTKTVIHIFCEGSSERNYFNALNRNKFISNYYVLKFHKNINDLERSIKKSERLDGIGIIKIYIYDSDVFKRQKKITTDIEKNKNHIYLNEEKFEDFLECHKARPIYKDNKKPNLSRHILEEIRNLDIYFIKKSINIPKKFECFKTTYDLLLELFENKL